MRGRTVRNIVQPHSTQNMHPVLWGSSHAVSRQKMQRMEPMLASGLLGDAICRSSCQVGTHYICIHGMSKGFHQKSKQKNNKQKQNTKASVT